MVDAAAQDSLREARKAGINDFVIKLANVNGTGSASANTLLMKSVFRMGVPVMGKNYFPSNIQGMPTWYEIRVSRDGYVARSGRVDLMVAMTWTGEAPFAGSYGDSQSMIDAMERWNDEVMSTVPSERLLVWHPEDGWEPLCAFLEVPVPDEPLPNVNDTRMFRDGIVAGALQAIQAWHDAETAPKPAA